MPHNNTSCENGLPMNVAWDAGVLTFLLSAAKTVCDGKGSGTVFFLPLSSREAKALYKPHPTTDV